MKWFRFYSEVLDDPKVQKLHPALFKHWVNLLCLASEMDDAGDLPDEEAIAFRLRVRTTEVRRILDQLVAAGLLDVCGNSAESRTLSAHNWQGRQRSSDNSSSRVARHRAANQENVTLQTPLPKRTVETDSDTDTEADTDVAKATNVASPKKSASYSSEFEEFWTQYPGGYGSKKATFAQWQRLRPDAALRAEIMQGLAAWQASDRWAKGFVKAAELWLRDELWQNPPPSVGPTYSNGKTKPGLFSGFEEFDRMTNGTTRQDEPDNVIEPEWRVR